MPATARIGRLTLAAAVIFLGTAYGQGSSNSSGTSSADGTTPTGPKPPTPDYTINATGAGATRGLQPLRVTGRVLAGDGGPLPSPAAIERVCNGTAHTEGYTDAGGYFSIALGQATDVVADAADDSSGSLHTGTAAPETGNVGTAGTGNSRYLGQNNRYANCDLRARLNGYRSKSISLANRGPMDNPDLGVILIRRFDESDGAVTVTATTLKAPKEARQALQEGMRLAKKNKPAEAVLSFQTAVQVDPQFAFAWVELGKAQLESGHKTEAREAFLAASKAEPRWPEPYLRLSLLALESHNWQEVADDTDRVLSLHSFERPQTFFFNAVANYNLGHVERAEKSAREAERLDPQHELPQTEDLLGNILADRHRYAEAAARFRAYLQWAPKARDAAATRKRLQEVEKLAASADK